MRSALLLIILSINNLYIQNYKLYSNVVIFEVANSLKEVTSPDYIESLQQKLSDYQSLFDSVEVAIIILNRKGHYLDYNQAYADLLGLPRNKTLHKFHPQDVSPAMQPDGRESFAKSNEMVAIAMEKGRHSFEWLHRDVNGKEFISHVILDKIYFAGEPCIRALVQDISRTVELERLVEQRTNELQEKNLELEQKANTDALTGLYNRNMINKVLQQELYRNQRFERPFSVILLDIDHFKQINDRHGHLIGDEVLVEFTRIISSHSRQSDFICRWGGEEFLLVLSETSGEAALQLAELLINNIRNHDFPHVGKISASMGIGEYQPGEELQSFLKRIDSTLYRAKENGRDQCVYSLPIMR